MSRTAIHSLIYFVLLAMMVIAIPTSNFLMSMAQVLLAVNWLIEGQWHKKISLAKRQPLLWAFVVLFVVHLVWCLMSTNMDYALDDIRKKLPLLAVPLVVLTSSPLPHKRLNILMLVYVATMLFVSAYSWVNHILNPDINYRSLFPFISHIRLALNACLVIFLLLCMGNKVLNSNMFSPLKQKIYLSVVIFLTGWFVAYLYLLQSYTGFIILLTTVAVVGFVYIKRHCVAGRLALYFVMMTAMVIAVVGMIAYYTNSYYKLKTLSTEPLKSHTINGNDYTHGIDGFVEHGNYLNNYICYTELEREWGHLSAKPLSYITPNGYSIKPTLIRYLNSKGLTKDSVGISQLTDYDVQAIEQGKATIYEADDKVLSQMMYRLLFEYENYRVYHRVKNSSLLQRFELWQNSCEIIARNSILGVGTGDVADEIRQNLKHNNSELKDTDMRTHSQYLTFILTFGLLGTMIIMFFFVYAIKKQNLMKSLLFVAYLCIVLISFVSEDTLETAAGCLFSTFFFCVFASQNEKNDSVLKG